MKVTMEINTATELRKALSTSCNENRLNYMTDKEIETIMNCFEDSDSEIMSLGELNDFFSYEEDEYCNWIGYDSFDEVLNRKNE